MTLQIIENNTLPVELSSQLAKDENVYYFSYLSLTGGCLGKKNIEDYWISLTNKRLLYKSKVQEIQFGRTYSERNGFIPIDKISLIETAIGSSTSGCSNVSFYELKITSFGGFIIIPIPTISKGSEIKEVYMKLIELQEK